MILDFRSDTVTRPSKAMQEAMWFAEVGDDVFGDDPTVNALQVKAAQLFGMEAALFCPSGTMTNQLAINVHCRPGDEIICEENAHVYLYEGGGIAKNSGASCRLLKGNKGQITKDQIKEAIRADDPHFPNSSLVCLENTSNKGGGTCYDSADLEAISSFCHSIDMPLHLDGARLFNALIASDQKTIAYGQWFDSISICLSKGLGCPIGSLLLGKKEFIYKAHRARKVFGGGMRQAGYLAAAGIYALDHHVERLAEDHKMAKDLAQKFRNSTLVKEVWTPETNILVADLGSDDAVDRFLSDLKSKGVLAVRFGQGLVRFTCHLDIDREIFEAFEF